MALIIDLPTFFANRSENTKSVEITSSDQGHAMISTSQIIYGDINGFNGVNNDIFLRDLLKKMECGDYNQCILGEYAIGYLDQSSRLIVFSRDFSGTRNIYYSIETNKLIIGVNVYDVVKQLHVRNFNAAICMEFLAFEYFSAPYTLFNGVYAIPHGCSIILDHVFNTVKVIRHVSLNEINESHDSKWPKSIRDLVVRAHKKRLTRRNGIYLSGGIDSSIMAISLRKDLNVDNLVAFTFSTKGAEQDEFAYAKRVAGQLGIHCEHIIVDPEEEIDAENLMLKANFPYIGAIILDKIGKHIHEMGMEGINLFAGQDSRLFTPAYNIVDDLVLNKLLRHSSIRSNVSKLASFIINRIPTGKVRKGIERLKFANVISEYFLRYFLHLHRQSDLIFSESLEYVRSQLKQYTTSADARILFNAFVDYTWDRQHSCDMAYMIGNTKAHGNICNMPYFDSELACLGASLSMRERLRLSLGRAGHSQKLILVNKYPIRQAYKGDLTKDLIYRDKAVCVTNHMYLNGALSYYVKKFFLKPRLVEIGLAARLNLDIVISRALTRSGLWTMHDYDDVVETHNCLFLEIIARQLDITSAV